MTQVKSALFTELTQDQCEIVEGGATLYLHKATAVSAGADFGFGNGDDVYARINGDKTRQTNDVDTGETANFWQSKSFTGTAKINLFDEDSGWGFSDDNLGGFSVKSTDAKGWHTKRVSGGGSVYDVSYYLY